MLRILKWLDSIILNHKVVNPKSVICLYISRNYPNNFIIGFSEIKELKVKVLD